MYTYGPVPSRRLGRSLGVSPIPPKTCTYSCVYCQLGRTRRLQIERESFYPKEEIFSEIRKTARLSNPDYVTFVGDGEPTLCQDLGWLINRTSNELHLPVAVITNGSLLSFKDARKELLRADVVLPSLDAGNERLFRRINRPHHALEFDDLLCGLRDFRREFAGLIWLEIMLVNGMNDTDEELLDIKNAVDMIQPDRIYVVTPVRPPAEPWVEPPSPENILRAQDILGHVVPLTGLESGDFGLGEFPDARQAIMEIGARHPLRLNQAEQIESAFSSGGTIKEMIKEGELFEVKYNNINYVLPGHFIRGKKTDRSGDRED
jgi:wyosine [tRNA(Phe)-imidazoG37] synthetase (radical SAM superfamily)